MLSACDAAIRGRLPDGVYTKPFLRAQGYHTKPGKGSPPGKFAELRLVLRNYVRCKKELREYFFALLDRCGEASQRLAGATKKAAATAVRADEALAKYESDFQQALARRERNERMDWNSKEVEYLQHRWEVQQGNLRLEQHIADSTVMDAERCAMECEDYLARFEPVGFCALVPGRRVAVKFRYPPAQAWRPPPEP